ncbi:MAG: CZB domain-containing protein [Bacillota bacterium]
MGNWKIKKKLILGMLVMVLISVILGILSNFTIKKITNSNSQVVIKLQRINSLHEREVKHLEWAENLKNLFLKHTSFHGELDYKKCDFGDWYYSFIKSDDFQKLTQEHKSIYLAMEEPHRKLHESAARIAKLHHQGDIKQAQEVYANLTEKQLVDFRKTINQADIYLMEKADTQINLSNGITDRAIFINNFSILAAIFLGLSITYILIKSIIRPITKFIEEIRWMNSNEGVYQPINGISTRDGEIYNLISTFNQMVVQVNHQQNELQEKNEELYAQGEELTAQNEEIRAQQEELEETLNILSKQEELLTRLYSFSQLLTQTIDFKELLQRILKGLQEDIGADAGAIYIYITTKQRS